MRKPPHLPKNDEDEEGETYHNIAMNSVDDELQGRYARPRPLFTGEKGNHYPKMLGESPLVTPQPDAKFDPDRDRIDPENVTDNRFGVDLFGGPPKPELEPPPATSVPSPNSGEHSRRDGGSSFPKIRRI